MANSPAFDHAASPIARHRAPLNSTSFSRDGSFFATADTGGLLVVWDSKSNLKYIVSFEFPSTPINALAWAKEGLLVGLRNGEVWSLDSFLSTPRSQIVQQLLRPVNALATALEWPFVAAAFGSKVLVARGQDNSTSWLFQSQVESQDQNELEATMDCQFIQDNLAVLWHLDGLRLYSIDEQDLKLECVWVQKPSAQLLTMTIHGSLIALTSAFDGLFCIQLPESGSLPDRRQAVKLTGPDALVGDGPTYILPAAFVARGLVLAVVSSHNRHIPIFSAARPNHEEGVLTLPESASASSRIITLSSRMAVGKTRAMLVLGDAGGNLHVWVEHSAAPLWKFWVKVGLGGAATAAVAAAAAAAAARVFTPAPPPPPTRHPLLGMLGQEMVASAGDVVSILLNVLPYAVAAAAAFYLSRLFDHANRDDSLEESVDGEEESAHSETSVELVVETPTNAQDDVVVAIETPANVVAIETPS
ncbi:WD-REPEATS-REGION domain-containing protein [Mycena chlorophos]|uniref:WD-REPEATS-REGION domain-containing protein n=1 Tax=Mycena chlorophos TaxID=658473 RepID=A0A8H6SBS9_MYCCL|nr:WD-REPEATS-REGION domain-containing protein [Mycena chlorophos]